MGSNCKDRFHEFTEKLYDSKDAKFVARPLGRMTDFYESEVEIDWSKCDLPQPLSSYTFANNPQWLKDHDRCDYRHRRIQEILKELIHKNVNEEFDLFIERAYSVANLALRNLATDKETYGDDYKELVARWVFRFVKGFKLLSQKTRKEWAWEDENMLYKLVREECDILSQQDIVFVDPHNKVRKVKRAWDKVGEDNYPISSKSFTRMETLS